MERNGLKEVRDDSSKRLEVNKVKDAWGYRYHHPDSISSGLVGGFSWPPRSYQCSICKREFRSAQALGGHMNVHRRERAKLRQWPPWDIKSSNLDPSPKPNPNPNPNFVPSSIASASAATRTRIPQFTSTVCSSLSSSVACFSSSFSSTSTELKMSGSISPFVHRPLFPKVNDSKGKKALLGVGEFEEFAEEERKDEMRVRLDMEIGLCGDLKEDLDLELRLGHI